MSALRLIFNLFWFVLGGFVMGIAWWFIGLLCFLSIVFIPFGRACFVIGKMAFWPFGNEHVNRERLRKIADIGTGPLGMIGNLVWLVFAGFWLALGHLLHAVACFVTIIGIPFALAHLKLATLTLMPIGRTVVNKR